MRAFVITRVGLGFIAAKKSASCTRYGWIKSPPRTVIDLTCECACQEFAIIEGQSDFYK
jgi:hypothetical protein